MNAQESQKILLPTFRWWSIELGIFRDKSDGVKDGHLHFGLIRVCNKLLQIKYEGKAIDVD